MPNDRARRQREITQRLRQWHEAMQDVDNVCGNLMASTGGDHDAPLFAAIVALQGLATSAIAELIGPEAIYWLEPWWSEHRLGEKPMRVSIDGGDWQEIKTIDQLAAQVADAVLVKREQT